MDRGGLCFLAVLGDIGEGRDGGALLLLGNEIEVLGCMEDWVDREGMMFLEVYRGEFVFVDE